MSRAARNRKILRSGAIGFVAGLATLGVVASGSPARGLVSSALGSGEQTAAAALGGAPSGKHQRSTANGISQQQLDQWLQQQATTGRQAAAAAAAAVAQTAAAQSAPAAQAALAVQPAPAAAPASAAS